MVFTGGNWLHCPGVVDQEAEQDKKSPEENDSPV